MCTLHKTLRKKRANREVQKTSRLGWQASKTRKNAVPLPLKKSLEKVAVESWLRENLHINYLGIQLYPFCLEARRELALS